MCAERRLRSVVPQASPSPIDLEEPIPTLRHVTLFALAAALALAGCGQRPSVVTPVTILVRSERLGNIEAAVLRIKDKNSHTGGPESKPVPTPSSTASAPAIPRDASRAASRATG